MESGSATAMVGLRLQRAHGGEGKIKGKVAMMERRMEENCREKHKEGGMPEKPVNDD